MQNKKGIRLFAGLMMCVMLLSACAQTSDNPATSGTTDGTEPQEMVLRAGVKASLSTCDPQMTGQVGDQGILINIFDPLVRRDANGELQPALAESWEVVDPMTWEFKLRQGVAFHNGEPFNAETVKFSLERVFQDGSKSPIQELRSFESVEVVDEYTVRIHTKEADPKVPDKLALFGGMMVPKQYLEEKGDEYFNSHPVGTGPFIFKEWVKDSHITMTGNPNYWKEPTKLSELTFKFIPDDAARVAALMSGDVQLIDKVDNNATATIEGNGNLRLDIADGIRIFYMSMAYPEGPMADAKVRQAISYAIDYQLLIDKLLGGYGVKIAGPYNTSNFGSDAPLTPYEYDLEKAKALLTEAGYPDGFAIEMNSDSEGADIAQAISGMLKQIGVEVELKMLPDAEYEDKYSSGLLAPLWVNGYSVWQGDPSTLIETFFKTGMPRAKYCSNDLDARIADMQTTMDTSERKAKLHEILAILHNDAPWAYLYQSNDIYGVAKNISWDISYDQILEMRTVTVG